MKIRPGIKLTKEIEGYGPPILKGDRFEAVYKYFYNKGDPILFDTVWHKLIPEIQNVGGKEVIGWQKPEMIKAIRFMNTTAGSKDNQDFCQEFITRYWV